MKENFAQRHSRSKTSTCTQYILVSHQFFFTALLNGGINSNVSGNSNGDLSMLGNFSYPVAMYIIVKQIFLFRQNISSYRPTDNCVFNEKLIVKPNLTSPSELKLSIMEHLRWRHKLISPSKWLMLMTSHLHSVPLL